MRRMVRRPESRLSLFGSAGELRMSRGQRRTGVRRSGYSRMPRWESCLAGWLPALHIPALHIHGAALDMPFVTLPLEHIVHCDRLRPGCTLGHEADLGVGFF